MSPTEFRTKYPEHAKLEELNGQNIVVGFFLDFLSGEDYVLAKWSEDSEELMPCNPGQTRLIAQFFDIDEVKLETEKRHMLEALQNGT